MYVHIDKTTIIVRFWRMTSNIDAADVHATIPGNACNAVYRPKLLRSQWLLYIYTHSSSHSVQYKLTYAAGITSTVSCQLHF